MSRRDIKGHWFVSGLVCVVILYFATPKKEQSESELRSALSEGTDIVWTASTHGATDVGRRSYDIALRTGIPAEEMQTIAKSKVFAVEANASANSPVATSPPIEEIPFFDPDVEYIWINQSDINRTPVNVGEYLDVNGESLPSFGSDANGFELTPTNVGEYLDPDLEPHEPLITNAGDSGNTHSNIGHYLDPDAESPGAYSVEPSEQKNVGPLLEVDF